MSSAPTFRLDEKGRPQPSIRQLFGKPVALVAFGFGSGLIPKAPGTAGTLAAIPFFLVLSQLPLYTYIAVIIIAFAMGIYICGQTSKWLGAHDHGGIVWDEFVGLWITLIGAPAEWPWLLAGFVLFRLFDMLKPWPISLADKHIHGGFGIMIDDVLAGIAAFACLQALALWLF
jgi:phosphatidylglycerophosphatase A